MTEAEGPSWRTFAGAALDYAQSLVSLEIGDT